MDTRNIMTRDLFPPLKVEEIYATFSGEFQLVALIGTGKFKVVAVDRDRGMVGLAKHEPFWVKPKMIDRIRVNEVT